MALSTSKKRSQSAIEDETSASPKSKRLRAEAITPTRRFRKGIAQCSQTSTKNPATAGNRLSAISQPEFVSRGTQTSGHVNIRSSSSSPTLIGSTTSHSIGISNSRSSVAGAGDHDSMANSIDGSCTSSALEEFSQAYDALSDTPSNGSDTASSSSGASSTKSIDKALGALNHAGDLSSLSTDSTSSSGISGEDDHPTESGSGSLPDLGLTRYIHPHGRNSLYLAGGTSVSSFGPSSTDPSGSSSSSSSSSSPSESSTSDSDHSIFSPNLNSDLSAITNEPPPSAIAALSSTPQLTTANLSALQTGLNALQSRITTLLPMLQAANQTLEIDRVEGRLAERDIEKVADGEEAYIEMNLGLGVLEEQRRQEQPQSGIQLPNRHHEDIASGSSDDDDEDDDDDERSERRSSSSSAATEKLLPKPGKKKKKKSNKSGEEDDVLGRLMGRSKATKKRKPNIEVL